MNILEKILEEIEEVKQRQSGAYLNGDYGQGIEYGMKFAQKIIREHLNDGWIPVTERVPEDIEYVLVTVNGRYKTDIFEGAIMIGDYSSKFEEWIIEGLEEWKNPNVTAWMPLPEPYKAE